MEKKKMELTPAQKAAVEDRGRSLMISAAAGSGKTATLTKRILSLITDKNDPADISGMLVVTFTQKAAGELRQRITDALAKALAADPGNRHLSNQLIAVGAAEICTIDAYYLRLIKENFQKLGLPSSFRMADPAETDLLAREVADRVIERSFAENPAFSLLADTLTGVRDDRNLTDLLLRLAEDTATLPKGPDTLEESADLFAAEAEQDFFAGRTGLLLKNAILPRLNGTLANLRYAAETAQSADGLEKYVPAMESDLAALQALSDGFARGAGYRELRELALAYSPARLGTAGKGCDPELKEMLKGIRDGAKDLLRSLAAREFALSAEEIARALRRTAELQRIAAAILREYTAAFREAKNARMLVDFSDLPVYVLQLLRHPDGSPTEVALAEQHKFQHIFVDEYQDTNAFQDGIFNRISNGHNLFIVGDIKQSIYAFRGARPAVFAAYRNRWQPIDAAEKGAPAAIYMSENFRCAKNVILFTNQVCGKLFSEAEKRAEPGKGLGYRREDDLIYAGSVTSQVPVTLYACEGIPKPEKDAEPPEDEESPSAAEKNGTVTELTCIVNLIQEIAIRRADPATHIPAYGDIAVLTRNSVFLSKVADALTAAGIPFSNNAKTDMFENPEVLLFYSLLSAIDNPMRDTALAGALRSPVLGFTLTDLVDVRMGSGNATLWEAVTAYAEREDAEEELQKKCRLAAERLTAWRALSEEIPIDRFVRILWRETGADGYAGSDPSTARQKPRERKQNLRALYDFARSFQAGGFRTLHDFVSFISGLLSQGTKIELPAAPAVGAVSLMTVHKSKGLEFPVVLLCGTSGKFNETDARAACVFTDRDNIGAVSKLTDPTGMALQDTPMRLALSLQTETLNTEEEIRILYVALTRAKEELVITAHGASGYTDKLLAKAAQLRERPAGNLLGEGKSWFEWILFTLSGLDAEREDGFFRLMQIIAHENAAEEPAEPEEAEPRKEETLPAASLPPEEYERRFAAAYAKISHAVDEVYPFANEARIPAKLSVSALYPDLITDAEQEETAVILSPQEERLPLFLGTEEAKAAEKGTATHLFLQFCDFSRLDGTDEATQGEIERLVSAGFLPARTAALVRQKEISRFARSRFFAELQTAAAVERERRFNILLPAADFTSDTALKEKLQGQNVLVQGVIDLFSETTDGKIVLCDYKTDRLSPEVRGDTAAVRALMTERHGEQLSYYAKAITALCGKAPDRICVFPLAFGEAVDIGLSARPAGTAAAHDGGIDRPLPSAAPDAGTAKSASGLSAPAAEPWGNPQKVGKYTLKQ